MMRALAQVLTEEYSEHGVHVANVIIDGIIDLPGTRALPKARQQPDTVMNPVRIAEAFYYLHTQDRSCWTHELQLTFFHQTKFLTSHCGSSLLGTVIIAAVRACFCCAAVVTDDECRGRRRRLRDHLRPRTEPASPIRPTDRMPSR